MNIEKLKNIIDNIVNKELIEKLSDFLAFAESYPGMELVQENTIAEQGYHIKLYWEKGENTINSRDGDRHMKFNLNEISFFLPLDLIKLQEAYDTLPEEKKLPSSYKVLKPVEDSNYMEALLSDISGVIINLMEFNGIKDNYSEIAKLFFKTRGKARGNDFGI